MPVFATSQTVCRRCVVRCDTVVYLSGCVAAECPSLYVNDRDGRTQLGCLHGIFTVEIDKAAFEALQHTPAGFGALRAVRPPLPICQTDVDQAFGHRATQACINPDFLLSGSRHMITVRMSPLDDDS
jgi:hypothetical protein